MRKMKSMSPFEFTEEDLKSNKHGFLSASQKAILNGFAEGTRRTQRGGLWVVIFFLFLGLCIILGMSLSNESTRRALFSSPFNLIALAMTIPVVLGIFGLSIWAAYRRADRLESAELKSVEGMARLDENHDSDVGSTYYVIINKVKLPIPEEASGSVFQEGKRYRIFYCHVSMLKFILSFESMD
jgi:hypothetical protein